LIADSKKLSKINTVNGLFDASKKIETIKLDFSDFGDYFNTPYNKYKEKFRRNRIYKIKTEKSKKS